jgi:hypothetical protein
MKLVTILEKYDTILLDQISSDKVDETISLRLPRPVADSSRIINRKPDVFKEFLEA